MVKTILIVESVPKPKRAFEDWPCLSAFVRLALLLAGYGLLFIVGLMLVGILLVFTGSLGESMAGRLGGSRLAWIAGYIVTFVLLLGAEVAVGAAIGLLICMVEARWPHNPISKLAQWVKQGVPN